MVDPEHGAGKLSEEARAVQFAMSVRGQYILSQALHYGIEALKAVEPESMQERANIADMEFLRENLFGLFTAAHRTDGEEVNGWLRGNS